MRTTKKVGAGGVFSLFKKKNGTKNNNSTVNSKVNNPMYGKKNESNFTDEQFEEFKENRLNLINKEKERITQLLVEIDAHIEKAVRLGKENKKEWAIHELRMKKTKEFEIKKVKFYIHKLIEQLKEVAAKKKSMKGGVYNKNFTFRNPFYGKKKTLKRSNASRNLYSNVNSKYGKLKRELELPVNSTIDDVLHELFKEGKRVTTENGQDQLETLYAWLARDREALESLAASWEKDAENLSNRVESENNTKGNSFTENDNYTEDEKKMLKELESGKTENSFTESQRELLKELDELEEEADSL